MKKIAAVEWVTQWHPLTDPTGKSVAEGGGVGKGSLRISTKFVFSREYLF
jgi:hypothetical protein